MDNYIIEYNKTGYPDYKIIEVSEDELYDLLEEALSTNFQTISAEREIFQVSCEEFHWMSDGFLSLYKRVEHNEPPKTYKEKVFKLVDGVPTGFTKQESYEIITTELMKRRG